MVEKRNVSLRVVSRNKNIIDHIKQLNQRHPFWGYRRVWAYLNDHKNLHVNKKRIYRLMKKYDLLVIEAHKIKAKRVSYPSKPKENRPNQILGTDMAKVKLPHVGWAYIVLASIGIQRKLSGTALRFAAKLMISWRLLFTCPPPIIAFV